MFSVTLKILLGEQEAKHVIDKIIKDEKLIAEYR